MDRDQWNRALKTVFRTGFLEISANLAGACIVTLYFLFFDPIYVLPGLQRRIYVSLALVACLLIVGITRRFRWEKDLIRFIKLKSGEKPVPPKLQETARKKILNLPVYSATVSFTNWSIASLIMAIYQYFEPFGRVVNTTVLLQSLRVFTGCIIGGIVTAAIVFFAMEIACQRIRPLFFPEGGLAGIPGTFRSKLQTRMMITFLLASVLPLVVLAVVSYNKARLMLTLDPSSVIESLFYLTGFLLIAEISMAVTLSHLFSRSILNPLDRIKDAISEVEKGNLSVSVAVTGNDELGELAEKFNRMIEGLRERYKMRKSMALAKEVQHNLLPESAPRLNGIDVAAKIVYCEETGGDYYDFFPIGKNRMAVVVGDVSDHGIPSALLMATARAFIRQRAAMGGCLADIVTDINRQICRDMGSSGRFITLFFCIVDPENKSVEWVNAGHEPALVLNPADKNFTELTGGGLPLGVLAENRYREYCRMLLPGEIIVIGTDGIRECRNADGEMFGKENLKEVIRIAGSRSAREIIDTIFSNIDSFRRPLNPEDDITLVVLKAAPM